MPDTFLKLKGLSIQKWWRLSPRWGHTYSRLGLAESAQADELQFARQAFRRKKENAERVGALSLQTSLQPDTSVQTMVSRPRWSHRNFQARDTAFSDLPPNRGLC